MTIADTDVLIDFLNDREPAAGWVAAVLEQRTLLTTAITRFELLAGAKSSRQENTIRALLMAIPALPLSADSADRAAKVRTTLEKQGLAIGMADSLIAGIVLEAGGALLTRNRRHFDRVEGLKIAAQ